MLDLKHNRREFLTRSAVLSAGAMMLPTFLKADVGCKSNGKRLIVIQLSGGNDGLNTVIPFRNDILLNQRPKLVSSTAKHRITDQAALNPTMDGFRSLYDEGDICILNSVGYPNPNRSHFRSMDIWQSGSSSDQYLNQGWIGRFLDNECSDTSPINGIEIGNILSMAMKGKVRKGIPFTNVDQFYRSARLISSSNTYTGSNPMAQFLYKTKNDTRNSAEYLYEKSKMYSSKKIYPQTKFGRSLREVAQMITTGVESPVYYVSLPGFDTHANQLGKQERLLKSYSDALKVFVEDLKLAGEWESSLIMTFSEFGRRVKQNASVGTDHGKANNLILAGGGLKKQGFYNEMPDLTNLDDGDLKHTIDFRQVYSTILEKWLGADSEKVLGKRFDLMGFV